MADPLFEIKDLHVRRGAVEVLKGLDLKMDHGQVVALIGANGAGKSTALLAISGLLPVHSGTIRFRGKEVQSLPAQDRVALGMTQVPEGRRIFPRLTVFENLQLGGTLRKESKEISKDLESSFDLFPILRKRRRQLAGTLSGGEQQMLALARGMMARPQLLMLDEPSLGLAPKMVSALFDVIHKIHSSGVPILLVEQNVYQALRVAHHVTVLETGRVALQGSAQEVGQDPRVKNAYLGGS